MSLTPTEENEVLTIAQIEAIVEKLKQVGWVRAAWNAALWFTLPFAALWGLGVDPTTAARVAVAPTVLVYAALTLWNLTMWVVLTAWTANLRARATEGGDQ